jgi:transcriptional regulator with XRE-family HTH domain
VLLEVARRRQDEARRIGGRIAELRGKHQLTQPAAADRIGVALRTYQTWEAGDAMPRWHNIRKIAEVYSVAVDHILGNPPEAPPQASPDQLNQIEAELSRQGQLLTALAEAVETKLADQASQSAHRSQRQDRSTQTSRGRRSRA